MERPTPPATGKRTARQISERVRLSPQALALLDDDPAPRTYVQRLMAEQLDTDAIRFLAHALPKRLALIALASSSRLNSIEYLPLSASSSMYWKIRIPSA